MNIDQRISPLSARQAGRLLVLALLLTVFIAPFANAQINVKPVFTFSSDGANPNDGLVEGDDGNFYGTTESYWWTQDYPRNNGTVFRITPDGSLRTIFTFAYKKGIEETYTSGPDGIDGAFPMAGLIKGDDGNFYGTTAGGGADADGYASTMGTVYRITPKGSHKTLHSFRGGKDGESPYAGLLKGPDGEFYGTTTGNGDDDQGAVFKITSTGLLTTLYSFKGGNDGGYPGGLISCNRGTICGVTYNGGANGWGTLFRLKPCEPPVGGAPIYVPNVGGKLTTVCAFTGENELRDTTTLDDLFQLGSNGDIYGMTCQGGAYGNGSLFKIATSGSLTTLYSFTGDIDGSQPLGCNMDRSGNFFGITWAGGTNGIGTVFKMTASGSLTTLHSITGNTDDWGPSGALLPGSDGNFYGTSCEGGAHGYGTVFKITASGSLTTIYEFGGDSYPQGEFVYGDPPTGLITGTADDCLYGTTDYGGANDCGTIFKVTEDGELTTLHSFKGGDDGMEPRGGLVQGSDGCFYGTTDSGGINDHGTVFKITSSGSLTTLHSFAGDSDGMEPNGGLASGTDGNFYGTTWYGGAYGNGTVFKITSSGSLTLLYSFTGGIDGCWASGGLVQGSDGNFYGTTSNGGVYGSGNVFKITLAGSLTTLFSFTGDEDGVGPNGGLVQGVDGCFYGTTSGNWDDDHGTVFKITSTGLLTTLYSFSGKDDGKIPNGGLIQGRDGSFYGVAENGGDNDGGTVFRITPDGVLTVLHKFSYGDNGANPFASLALGRDGNLYGMSVGGYIDLGGYTGTVNFGGGGVIFRVALNGVPLPVITLKRASSISANAAALHAVVTPNGGPTTVYFNWGQDASYGNTTASQKIGSAMHLNQGSSNKIKAITVSKKLAGLTPETAYHFQAVVVDGNETSFGPDQTFATSR